MREQTIDTAGKIGSVDVSDAGSIGHDPQRLILALVLGNMLHRLTRVLGQDETQRQS